MARSSFHVRRPSWGQRTARRERAAEREQARAALSDAEQLEVLKTRRGQSRRETLRLQTTLDRPVIT